MFVFRDFRFKLRYFTDFKHQKTLIEHDFGNLGVSLHHKKILMVKVYG